MTGTSSLDDTRQMRAYDTGSFPVVQTPVLELRDVTKVYRTGTLEVEALRGVSTTISEAEYVAIMGPSGAGTST